MEDAKSSMQRLVDRCFTKQELEFLLLKEEFSEAVRDVTTIDQAEKVINLGERLIREAWWKLNYPQATRPSQPDSKDPP